jgi:tetratricopeptide (TPR) repeat protein
MDLDYGNLTNPLKEARRLEDRREYEQAKKMFLDYFEACTAQKQYRSGSLLPNMTSALKGAARCYLKTDMASEAKDLLTKNLSRFNDDYNDPALARFRSRIERSLSDVLKLEKLVNEFHQVVDDFVSGSAFDKMDPRFKKGGRISFRLEQPIQQIILLFDKIDGKDAAKNLVDLAVSEVKSRIGKEITWEPQFFSDIAVNYGNLGYCEEAIKLSLYSIELAKGYGSDLPQNYRFSEENMRHNLIEWYLIVGDFDECEKWLPTKGEGHSVYAGHQYLRMKRYEKAKECYEESITGESHKWSFGYELMDLCDRRLGNETNQELLRYALETYEQREPKGFMVEYISRLDVLRVKDSLEGVKEDRYLSLIDELNRESLTEDTTLSLIPITFYLYLIGLCYLRIGDREKAFKSFDRVVKIEREDRFTWNWTAEPDYSDFYDRVCGEMLLRELYDERFRVARFPKDVLKFEFTDEEFETFTRRTKKEHLEEGVQGEPDEIMAIVRSPFF